MSVRATTAQKNGSVVVPGRRSAGMPKPEQEDDQDAGDAAEDVDVDGGGCAEREEDGALEVAQHGQEQSTDQDQHL